MVVLVYSFLTTTIQFGGLFCYTKFSYVCLANICTKTIKIIRQKLDMKWRLKVGGSTLD